MSWGCWIACCSRRPTGSIRGVLAIINFHSLEDRRVKTAFLQDERLARITRKPLIAAEAEEAANPAVAAPIAVGLSPAGRLTATESAHKAVFVFVAEQLAVAPWTQNITGDAASDQRRR